MRLIDLTRTLDSNDRDRLPETSRLGATVLVPEVEYTHPSDRGAAVMAHLFGCSTDDLPDGEGWGEERLTISSHLGTHVDAPLHYGSTCEGQPARTIEQIELSELYAEAIVLDVRAAATPGEGISVDALRDAVAASGGTVPVGGAVFIRSGQEAYDLDDPRFYSYPGMTRDGTLFLADLGAKILGTDALGWDRPFASMRRAFHETGDQSQIWDGHFAGRDREVFIVQQLTNLAAVPSHGFTVGCFPIKLAHCSAAPARVVAFVPD